MSPNLSKAQLLNFLQCPRRFWLEQYHPEHEGDVAAMDAALDAEEAADAIARATVKGEKVRQVIGRLGLRNAIEQTGAMLEAGSTLLDATFEHEAISAQVDVLDWTNSAHRAISVTAATELSQRHIEDCAVQAWTIRGLQLPEHRYLVGLSTENQSVSGEFSTRFELRDVTDEVLAELDRIDCAVADARTLHAALDEPQATPGSHCHKSGYVCPFLDYCDQR